MARPRKIPVETGEVKTMADEYLPLVKFIVVPVSINPSGVVTKGAMQVRDADSLLSDWVGKGYKLLSVVGGEFIPNDRVQLVCTLVKE